MGTSARWPHRLLFGLAVLNGVAALAGAAGLATGALDVGATVVGRLPWQSPVVAGIALGLLVALPNAVLAGVVLRGARTTGIVGLAVGAGMVAWILVELAFIRELSFFHPVYVTVGLVMIWAAARTGPWTWPLGTTAPASRPVTPMGWRGTHHKELP